MITPIFGETIVCLGVELRAFGILAGGAWIKREAKLGIKLCEEIRRGGPFFTAAALQYWTYRHGINPPFLRGLLSYARFRCL